MGDDSRKSQMYSLKNEWSLLWESLAGDGEDESAESLENLKTPLKALSMDELRILKQELSQDRRSLNNRFETLNKELELNTAKLESLRMMGREDEETALRIRELNDQGHKISLQMIKLDEKLKMARDHEERIRRSLTPA